MNRTAIFSKTGKGLLEIKNRANRLSKDQYRLLNLVDGKSTLSDLAEKGKMSEIEARKVLSALADSGYIKEFTNATQEIGVEEGPPPASYANDLDFTAGGALHPPAKPSIYQSALTEQRQREEAERKASEAAASKARAEAEKRTKEYERRKAEADAAGRKLREEAERQAKLETERQERLAAELRAKVAAELKAKEGAERQAQAAKERAEREEQERKQQAELRAKEEAERRVRIQAEARARLEAEKQAKEEQERKLREEEERRRKEEAARKIREEEERRRKEEEARKQREEEERRRKEEEARRRQEEERKRKEEEERKRREEEERKRKEEEERKRREEEERKRKEEEARKQREEEERRRKEEEARKQREEEERRRKEEEARKQREEEERRRKEEEARKQREEEERRRKEEEARKQREEDERRRKEEEARKQREEEERAKAAQPSVANVHDELNSLPTMDARVDLGELPKAEVQVEESDAQALLRVEAQVEKEFVAREEAIRIALAEQERRFRMEEEARAAMDRAEREARERADKEARELAAAAERARKEAEQSAREEAARRTEEDKARRAREKAERKKQTEENHKKRERERREAEQRSREEELLRRRKEQDEADRRKSELDRLQRQSRMRSWGPGKIAAAAVALLVLIAVAVVQLVPFSVYAPNIAAIASSSLGEPVRIGGVKASLFPAFHLELQNVTLGDLQDVHASSVHVYMSPSALVSEDKQVDRLVVESLVVPQEAMNRVKSWLMNQVGGQVRVDKLELRSARLELKTIALPAFDATLTLGDNHVRAARIDTNDGHFSAQLTASDEGMSVRSSGRNFRMPFGPSLEFTSFEAKALLRADELQVSELTYSVYGGQGSGSARVTWGDKWFAEGRFEFERVVLETAMQALGASIPSQGTLAGEGKFSMTAAKLDAIADEPRVDASFKAHKGVIAGLDLVRALQSPSREGTAGGQTKYEEISGRVVLSGGRYQYSGVRMASGALTASGQAEISRSQDVTGKALVELKSSARPIRANFKIGGTTKGMLLRQ